MIDNSKPYDEEWKECEKKSLKEGLRERVDNMKAACDYILEDKQLKLLADYKASLLTTQIKDEHQDTANIVEEIIRIRTVEIIKTFGLSPEDLGMEEPRDKK